MSRKKLQTGSTSSRAPTFNSLVRQLETPRSFINLLPEDARPSLLSLPDELLNIDEETFFGRRPDFRPTAIQDALRFNFWMEHDRVVPHRTEIMNLNSVYFGVCSREYWHKLLHELPDAMCYILCRPPQYTAMMNALSNQWTKKLRDILNIPIKKANGEYQEPKVLDLILKAGAMVDLRTQGGYLTRSETKNLTYMETRNKNESVTKIFSASSSEKSVQEIEADIDEKLRLLEQDLKTPAPQNQSSEPPQASPSPSPSEITDAEFTEVKK